LALVADFGRSCCAKMKEGGKTSDLLVEAPPSSSTTDEMCLLLAFVMVGIRIAHVADGVWLVCCSVADVDVVVAAFCRGFYTILTHL